MIYIISFATGIEAAFGTDLRFISEPGTELENKAVIVLAAINIIIDLVAMFMASSLILV